MFIICVGLFLDFTGILPTYLGWAAQIQFIPALLALNLGVLAVLVVLALIFGRLYCSIICPLGIFQDMWSGLRGKKRKYKFWKQTKAVRAVRYGLLGIFAIMIIAGITSYAAVIEPYSAFGRMMTNLFSPISDYINNQLASAEAARESYTYFTIDIWIRGISSFILAIITFIGLAVTSVLTGRGYCNTVCPVGTLLGFAGKFSLFKVRIDADKCKGCRACANKCKGHCIDIATKSVDYERCVTCMNCLSTCKHEAIAYTPSLKAMIRQKGKIQPTEKAVDKSVDKPESRENAEETSTTERAEIRNDRRAFLMTTAAGAAGALLCPALSSAEETPEGSLADVSRKEAYPRETRITPPGSTGHTNFDRRCVGCMLCVRACHNNVLRAGKIAPEMSYERGYCRPTCNDCSTVCPTGAIREMTLERKSSTQIGRAVWKFHDCINTTKSDSCKACMRACPNGSITFTESKGPNGKKIEIPVVDQERCIGCGACEYVCPARPVAAIHVEGNLQHREI